MSCKKQIFVCQYQSCLANGAAEVLATFLAGDLSDYEIVASGCQGQCNVGVTVRVLPDEIWYCRVKPEDVDAIALHHLEQGEPVQRLLHPRFHPSFDHACDSSAS